MSSYRRSRTATKNRRDVPRPRVNPWEGRIGWCHSCCTVQMGDEARWQPMEWNSGWPDWSCVSCDDEPWGIGVWADSLGYEEAFTQAATDWLDAPSGRAWLALDECDWCGSRHLDANLCPNPPTIDADE